MNEHATARPKVADEPLVRVEDLKVAFDVGRRGFWGRRRLVLHAVDGVSFAVRAGETLGLVGESGSGKSTTGRAVLRQVPLRGGRVWFRGEEITHLEKDALRPVRRHMQLVFQDPYASLNPRMRILDIVAEPLIVHGMARNAREAANQVVHLLELVGLPADAARRYPHAFSGGQRQRVGIARALALHPEFLVADEPVSALDVSIRAQIVNLMQDLQCRLGLSYLFIAHDLAVVRHISHRIAIMLVGRIVEIAEAEQIYNAPVHPYTEALLSAVPVPHPKLQRQRRRIVCVGELPDPLSPLPGCRFYSRCFLRTERCAREDPPLTQRGCEQWAACWNR